MGGVVSVGVARSAPCAHTQTHTHIYVLYTFLCVCWLDRISGKEGGREGGGERVSGSGGGESEGVSERGGE